MKKIFITLCLLSAAGASAQSAVNLSLKDCEQAALSANPQLQAKAEEAASAQSSYKNARSALYPTLNLEGKGGWVSEVPELEMFGSKLSFGDNWSYSAGPVLYYTLFDFGGRSNTAKSVKSVWQAKQADYEWTRKQILMNTRIAYFKVQADLEKIYLLSKQLELSRRQLKDITNAYKAGAKSDLDVKMADKQVLSFEKEISATRAQLSSDLRDLFELTKQDFGINPAYATDYRIKNTGNATAVLKADDLDASLEYFKGYNSFSFDEDSPKLLAADKMSEYYTTLSKSYTSSLYPKISLTAGAYWEYPNGPIKEHVFLGKAGASISMPLFEGSRTRSKAKEQRHMAASAQKQRESVYDNMNKIFNTAKDRVYSLGIEIKIAEQIIKDSQKVSELSYSAYNAGAVTYLEVDNANVNLSAGEIALAGLKIENLMQLAVIASLGR